MSYFTCYRNGRNLHKERISALYFFYVAEVQEVFDHILERREREQGEEEMKGALGSQEGSEKRKEERLFIKKLIIMYIH